MNDPKAGTVEKGMFILPSGNGMSSSCHHRKHGACGGCYARAIAALEDIAGTPSAAFAIVHDLFKAMRAEGRS